MDFKASKRSKLIKKSPKPAAVHTTSSKYQQLLSAFSHTVTCFVIFRPPYFKMCLMSVMGQKGPPPLIYIHVLD